MTVSVPVHPAASLSWARSDRVVLPTLFLATIATRLPFVTTMLFNWDSANFALGVRAFDVTQHHPHPPGYFFYVATGNLLSLLLGGDVNAGLVGVSLLLSAFAVPVTYALGRAMFNRRVGLIAALFMLTSVTFWSYGGIALAYPALALFSAWVAFSAYRARWHNDPGAWLPLAVAYTIGGGFRPDLLLFLGPVTLLGLTAVGARRAIAGVVVAAIGGVAWLGPTVALSGGVGAYLAVLQAYVGGDVIDRYASPRHGLGGLIYNVRDVVAYTWYAVYAMAAPLLAGAAIWTWRRRFDHRAWFIIVWLGPMLLFYVIIHIGDPGYVFAYLPALALLAAKGVDELAHRWTPTGRAATISAALTAVVIGVNSAVFLWYPRTLTAIGVQQADRLMTAKIAYLAAQPDDGRSLLLSYDSYRHLQYYLPQWRNSLWVDPLNARPQTTALAPETRWLIVVDARLLEGAGPRPAAEPLAGGALWRVPVQPGQTLTFGGGVLRLQ